MKNVFIMLFMFSSLAFAQTPSDAVAQPEPREPMADVQGPYVKPTPVQKARVHAAAKMAKKKKLKAKVAKKTKKTKKSTK